MGQLYLCFYVSLAEGRGRRRSTDIPPLSVFFFPCVFTSATLPRVDLNTASGVARNFVRGGGFNKFS